MNSERFPFNSVSEAIHFYRTKNPARMRSVGALEPDHDTPDKNHEFELQDLWASVTLCIDTACKDSERRHADAFIMYELKRVDIYTINQYFGLRGEKTVYAWVAQVRKKLRRELEYHDLIKGKE